MEIEGRYEGRYEEWRYELILRELILRERIADVRSWAMGRITFKASR